MRLSNLMALAISTVLVTGDVGATGLMRCDSGEQSTWQSQQVLTDKITAEGWQVRRVKIDGGCYEVYGTTPQGERVEAYFHPVTLEKLLVARRGQILFRKSDSAD